MISYVARFLHAHATKCNTMTEQHQVDAAQCTIFAAFPEKTSQPKV
jgi:hypothetical protein